MFLQTRAGRTNHNTLYIFSSISTSKRQTITMLRCGCLRLEVETGHCWSPKKTHLIAGPVKCAMMDPLEIVANPYTNVGQSFIKQPQKHDYKEVFYTLTPEKRIVLLMQLCSANPAIAKIIYDMFLV